ncbi:DUF4652 domain-containing protein [Lysinibacillus capsici]
MGDVIYYQNEKRLELIRTKKNFEFISKPVEHDDYLFCIQPFEWECKGDLIKINTNTGVIEKSLIIDSKDLSIKNVYIHSKKIYLVIGYLWGTVNQGGDLFKCDMELENLSLLKKFDENIQVTEILGNEGDYLNLRGIRYIDENFNEHEEIFIKYDL